MTKTLTAAAALIAFASPLFAAAHLSADMTCADYMGLSEEDQMAAVAMFDSTAQDGSALEGDAAGTTEGEDAAETTTTSMPGEEMMANAMTNCEGNDDMMASEAAMMSAE